MYYDLRVIKIPNIYRIAITVPWDIWDNFGSYFAIMKPIIDIPVQKSGRKSANISFWP